jgi:hypothetical protein
MPRSSAASGSVLWTYGHCRRQASSDRAATHRSGLNCMSWVDVRWLAPYPVLLGVHPDGGRWCITSANSRTSLRMSFGIANGQRQISNASSRWRDLPMPGPVLRPSARQVKRRRGFAPRPSRPVFRLRPLIRRVLATASTGRVALASRRAPIPQPPSKLNVVTWQPPPQLTKIGSARPLAFSP